MTSGTDAIANLLRQFNVAEPLIGDLLEEYACGRSEGWLWRQTAAAIVRAVLRDLRQRKLLGTRAAATGTVTILAASAAKARVTQFEWASQLPTFWVLTLLSFFLAGWVVGATHRQHRVAMVLAFLSYAIVAKCWVYTSHFAHYWRPDQLDRFFLDAGFTCVGFAMIVIGGLMPRWHTDSC